MLHHIHINFSQVSEFQWLRFGNQRSAQEQFRKFSVFVLRTYTKICVGLRLQRVGISNYLIV